MELSKSFHGKTMLLHIIKQQYLLTDSTVVISTLLTLSRKQVKRMVEQFNKEAIWYSVACHAPAGIVDDAHCVYFRHGSCFLHDAVNEMMAFRHVLTGAPAA
jgi:hypothetical protein